MRDQFAGQFQHDPAGHLGTDARDLGEGLAVPGVRGHPDRLGLMDGEHCQGKPGPDAADTEQDVEYLPFVVGGKAEKRERILPDDQGREQFALRRPTCSRLSVCGVAFTLIPAPLRSITAVDRPTCATVPRRKLIKAGLLCIAGLE